MLFKSMDIIIYNVFKIKVTLTGHKINCLFKSYAFVKECKYKIQMNVIYTIIDNYVLNTI